MGTEQSHNQNEIGAGREATEQKKYDTGSGNSSTSSSNQLQKRNTIHCTSDVNFENGKILYDGRPTSPPMSVCSDSDLPYISYTDRPIGDSPKIRNKNQTISRNVRSNSMTAAMRNKPSSSAVKAKQRPVSGTHNIVVVKNAVREPNMETDPDFVKIQNIPIFLPVMRGTLSLPSSRDPDILDRLQPQHLQNICSRMQSHFNVCAMQIANDQGTIMGQIKEVDYKVTKLFSKYVEMQKAYAAQAETFSRLRMISQQLIRCNTSLNQNIESLEELNNALNVEDRMEPFVWKTNNFY